MRTLLEHVLLLEYDHDKTWEKHGEKIAQKMWKDRAVSTSDLESFSPKEIFDSESSETDPTPHREYGQWIAHHYANGGIRSLEDFPRTNQALIRFHDAKRRGHLKQLGISADINQHKGLGALEDVVDKLPKPEPKDPDKPEPHEYERHDEEHWTHYTPHTQKASCYFGRGSRWCTAATKGENMFNDYHKDGPLHIMVPKNPRRPGEKYQYHVSSGSFMNERDEEEDPHHEIILGKRPSPKFDSDVRAGLETKYPEGAVIFWPPDKRRGLLNHPDPKVRMHTLYHHFADDQHALANAAVDPNSGVRHFAVVYGKQPILSTMIHDPDDTVRAAVARRTSFSDHHEMFSNDPSHVVRMGVAENNHLNRGHQIFEKLASDPEPSVRQRVALNAADHIRESLMKDPEYKVRSAVLLRTNSRNILSHLAYNDPDEGIKRSARNRLLRDAHDLY